MACLPARARGGFWRSPRSGRNFRSRWDPITEWGHQRFGGADVPAEKRLADLENSLTQVKLDPAENVPLLVPLLNIPLPQERMPTSTPEELRRRQLAALIEWVVAAAGSNRSSWRLKTCIGPIRLQLMSCVVLLNRARLRGYSF